MVRTKQSVSEGGSQTMKGLREQINALQQKIDMLERSHSPLHKSSENNSIDKNDMYITLPQEKMVELLGILTHFLKKEQQKDYGNSSSFQSPSSESIKTADQKTDYSASSPPSFPWRRFTTFA